MATDAADKLKDAIADGSAEADEVAEDAAQSHHDTLQALLGSPEGRDVGLWEEAYIALLEPFDVITFEDWIVLTSADFVAMDPSPFRAPAWQAMVAAATAQSNLDVIRGLLPVVDKQAAIQNADAAKLSAVQLKAVAAEGVTKQRFQRARDDRKAARVAPIEAQ